MILRQHYCIILAASLEKNIFLYIGQSGNNSLDNFQYKPYFAKKNCNDVLFLFCFFAG